MHFTVSRVDTEHLRRLEVDILCIAIAFHLPNTYLLLKVARLLLAMELEKARAETKKQRADVFNHVAT